MISTTVLRPPRTYLLTYLPSDWLGLSREQRLMLCWDAAKDVTRLLTTPIDVVRRTDTVMAGRRAPIAARPGRVSAREAALTFVWSTATLAAVVSVFCVQPTGQSVCQSHLRWDDVVCLFLHKNTTHLTLLVEFVDQSTFSLALWRPLLPYGYSYRASCVTLQGRVKQSFVIFDIQALWRSDSDAQSWASECPNVKNDNWQLNPALHRTLYSCTHMAKVDVKGLNSLHCTYITDSRSRIITTFMQKVRVYSRHTTGFFSGNLRFQKL